MDRIGISRIIDDRISTENDRSSQLEREHTRNHTSSTTCA